VRFTPDSPEEKEALQKFYALVSKHLTPDFSEDFWIDLLDKADAGDPISQDMFCSLWVNKVNPYLPNELRMENW